jgi:ADP-ribose pyrophosphatase
MNKMIINRKTTVLSPWVTLVEKTLNLKAVPAVYHSFQQDDYVTILAVREDGKIPIVRQFRNAIERLSWELPGGIVDTGCTPLEAAHQELHEEAGLI